MGAAEPGPAGTRQPARRAAPARYDPAVVLVRLAGPPAAITAAGALLADLLGPAWQESARKPSRHAGGDQLQYGTMIVPVPRSTP